jgi:hypothetical protein
MTLKNIEAMLQNSAKRFDERAHQESCQLTSLELRSAANALRRAAFEVGYADQCLAAANILTMAPWEGPCQFGGESLQSNGKS